MNQETIDHWFLACISDKNSDDWVKNKNLLAVYKKTNGYSYDEELYEQLEAARIKGYTDQNILSEGLANFKLSPTKTKLQETSLQAKFPELNISGYVSLHFDFNSKFIIPHPFKDYVLYIYGE